MAAVSVICCMKMSSHVSKAVPVCCCVTQGQELGYGWSKCLPIPTDASLHFIWGEFKASL